MNIINIKNFLVFLLISSVFISCNNKDVSDIGVTETNKNLMIGDTLKLATIIKAPEDKDFPTKWLSSNEEVATVNENGLVIAQATGDVSIIAQAGKKEAKCEISVFNYIFTSATSYNNNEISGINSNMHLSLTYNKPVMSGSDKKTDNLSTSTQLVFDIKLPENITKLNSNTYGKSENREDYSFLPGKIINTDSITGSYLSNNYSIKPDLVIDGLFDVTEVNNNYIIIGNVTTAKENIRFQYQGAIKERSIE